MDTDTKLEPGTSWHAIRRTLLSSLSLACPGIVLSRFMGWKTNPETQTLYTYTRPPADDVDALVFKNHPFIGMWDRGAR